MSLPKLFCQALCEEFEEDCCVSLAQTIDRHLSEAQAAKSAGNTKVRRFVRMASGMDLDS